MYATTQTNFKNKMLSEMSDTKGQIMYDSIYMKFLEQSNS